MTITLPARHQVGDDVQVHLKGRHTFRTDWIETVLEKVGVPGCGYTAEGWDSATANSDRGGAAA
jgi:hypothetical protein